MLASLFAVLTLVLLMVLVFNAARLTTRKLEVQNAADATAQAAGIEMARALNSVTALNHQIGELNALSALINAFGGTELEEKKTISLATSNNALSIAHGLAQFFGPALPPLGFKEVSADKSRSGAAIGASRKRLQLVMAEAYWVHAAGGVLATEPGLAQFAATGVELMRAARKIEANVVFEWQVLDKLEVIAEEQLLPIKQRMNSLLIPKLYAYCEKWVEKAPQRAADAAEFVAQQHRTANDGGTTLPLAEPSGQLFPEVQPDRDTGLQLPVVREEIQRETATHTKSQMVRAMTPWVQYSRKPILQFGRVVLPLSRFARHYHESSNEFTLNMAWWQWKENKTKLFVLRDLDVAGTDKGREPWTRPNGSARADELFALVGFAHERTPAVIAFPRLPQTQTNGLAAFAQVLMYNANPQERERIPDWQPTVGWDTLNWANDVPEYSFGERYGSDRELREPPRIKLNWQAKLVPTTRLSAAAEALDGPLGQILQRTATDTTLANTH
jgi:hypothetical protein